ncbi:MAG: DMT family transporter [Candidatus Limiplasma sp.]|nr:DMT family transporter [Candidatus Limiplasma sp.]
MSFTLLAFLAAALYALNAPLSKLLLQDVSPAMMAAFLYLGAGIGMLAIGLIRSCVRRQPFRLHFTRKDAPYVAGMTALDVAAPILLMLGLTMTSSASASLLNNFEIVATTLIAMLLFREKISKRLWLAIGLITLSGVLLSLEGGGSLHFSLGSLLVLLACICWGLENNCTRMLSHGDPLEVVVVKGIGSGLGSLLIGLCAGEPLPAAATMPLILLLGFVAYGLSIYCYVYAQRGLGAAKTSAYYAVAPFIGVFLSLLIFREIPSPLFTAAFLLMAAGTWLVGRVK